MPDISLSVNNLQKSFGERQSIEAVCCQLAKGKILGLLGLDNG